MKRRLAILLGVFAAAVISTSAPAQSPNLEKLKQFKVSTRMPSARTSST